MFKYDVQGLHSAITGLLSYVIVLGFYQPHLWAGQRVLVIHSYHGDLPWTEGIKLSLTQGLEHEFEDIDISHKFLYAKDNPELPDGEDKLRDFAADYQPQTLDLLIVSDDPGLQLVLRHRETYFTDVPIVFLGINQVDANIEATPNMTGVYEKHSTVDTALVALQQTNTEHLIVLNDTTETGQANLTGIDELRVHPNKPSITVINDVTPDEIEQRLGSYPDDWPILVLGQLRKNGRTGALLSFAQTARILSNSLPNPLYVEAIPFIGHGVVGGKVLDTEGHVQQAVDLAQRILQGESADDIPSIKEAQSLWLFETEQLERFNIDQNLLPPGNETIPKPASRKPYLLIGLVMLGILLTIAAVRQGKCKTVSQ